MYERIILSLDENWRRNSEGERTQVEPGQDGRKVIFFNIHSISEMNEKKWRLELFSDACMTLKTANDLFRKKKH